MVFHICGASGSGKTTLGNKLKEKWKSKIVVKDLDELRDEFIAMFYGSQKWKYIDFDAYQKYINEYIARQTAYTNSKPLILVGLSDNTVFGKPHQKKLYYTIDAKYKYYIDVNDMSIVTQKCTRLLTDIQNDDMAMNDLVNNNSMFVRQFSKAIKKECAEGPTIKQNQIWKHNYVDKMGYKLMTFDAIFNNICRIIIAKRKDIKTKKHKKRTNRITKKQQKKNPKE